MYVSMVPFSVLLLCVCYQVNESEAEKVLFEDRSPETFMVGSHILHQILCKHKEDFSLATEHTYVCTYVRSRKQLNHLLSAVFNCWIEVLS